MSRTVSRLLLTFSLLVGSVTVYVLLFIVIESRWLSRDAEAFVAASLVTVPFFGRAFGTSPSYGPLRAFFGPWLFLPSDRWRAWVVMRFALVRWPVRKVE